MQYDPTPDALPRIDPIHVVIEGDCLVVMKGLDDESFHAVITDPPYGINYQSGHRVKTETLARIANDKRPFIWWLYDAYRITVEGGHLLCFCRWDVQDAFKTAIEWAGFTIKGQLIWNRENHGSGDLNGGFAPQHDVIWHATKGRGIIYGKRPVSVIPVMRLSGGNLSHPNEKPVDLLRYLVRAVTLPGMAVLDPFAGSASTGKACQLEGRSFTGIELDPYYAAFGNKRLAVAQLTMDFGSDDIEAIPDTEISQDTEVHASTEGVVFTATEEELSPYLDSMPIIIDDPPMAMTPENWDTLATMARVTKSIEFKSTELGPNPYYEAYVEALSQDPSIAPLTRDDPRISLDTAEIYQHTMMSQSTERKEEPKNEIQNTVEAPATHTEYGDSVAPGITYYSDEDLSAAMAAVDDEF